MVIFTWYRKDLKTLRHTPLILGTLPGGNRLLKEGKQFYIFEENLTRTWSPIDGSRLRFQASDRPLGKEFCLRQDSVVRRLPLVKVRCNG